MTSRTLKISFILLQMTFISFLIAPYNSPGIITMEDNKFLKKFNANDVMTKDSASSHDSGSFKNITLQDFFSVVNESSDNVFLIWPMEPLLIYRAICAAESWALNHPDLHVWYVFTVNELQDRDGLVRRLLQKYSNLKFIYCDLRKLFEDTSLYKLSLTSAWKKSSWAGTHLSDMMRQALLWHKGGYYSDTDMYPFTNLSKFRNFARLRHIRPFFWIDPALLHFDHHHPYTKAVMETIANDYHPRIYNHHGPKATTVTGLRLCNATGDMKLQSDDTYRDCTVSGHTISFQDPKYTPTCCGGCFHKGSGRLLKEYIASDAVAFHSCNVMTRETADTFRSEGYKSLLQAMAEKNCPLIFNIAKEHSNFW